MKTIFRVILALMTLIALSAAQAVTIPISTIQNATSGQCLTLTNPLTMTDCDGLPDQNFSFGRGAIYNNTSPAYPNTSNSFCLDGGLNPTMNATGDKLTSPVGMGLCAKLNGYWFRPGHNGKHIYMSGNDRLCLTQVGSTVDVETCDLANPNSDWILNSAVPDDWPHTGLTTIGTNPGCLFVPGAQASSYVPGTQLSVGYCGDEYPNSFFNFTPNGTITIFGYCVGSQSDSAGDALTIENCDGTTRQQWHLSGVQIIGVQQIVSDHNHLCFGVKGNPGEDDGTHARAQLQTCDSNNIRQQWSMNVSESWPPPPGSVPSTAVAGATLTADQVLAIVLWIQNEVTISNTQFCWKQPSYDRGIGVLPNACPSGQYNSAGYCYDNCRDGYVGVGPVCWSKQAPFYNPGFHCAASIPDWLGGGCIWYAMNSCKDGYTGDQIATCWIDKAAYGNGAGNRSTSCLSNREMRDGLCYNLPRTGYTCTVTDCTESCASGTSDCGFGCAQDSGYCGTSITDMVVSPLLVLTNILTEGAATPVTDAVKAVKNAKEMVEVGIELVNTEEILRSSIGNFMNMAEENLAAISSDAIEAQVAHKYGPKSNYNYKFIARTWAAMLLYTDLSDLTIAMSTLMDSTIDPTGVVGTINAFTHPPCSQHTDIP